eukprot:sb/3472729/
MKSPYIHSAHFVCFKYVLHARERTLIKIHKKDFGNEVTPPLPAREVHQRKTLPQSQIFHPTLPAHSTSFQYDGSSFAMAMVSKIPGKTEPLMEPTNQNSVFRSRDWLSANQGPVIPDSVLALEWAGLPAMYSSLSSGSCPVQNCMMMNRPTQVDNQSELVV